MPEKQLKEALEKLTLQLDGIDQNDAESREMLESLVKAIECKLASPDAQEHHGLTDRIKEKTLYFENKHPVIGNTLEEIIAILTRLGI